MQHFISLTVVTELHPGSGAHDVRRTGTCWSEPRGPKMLWRQLRELGCGAWRREGSGDTIEPLPVPKVATRELERDIEQGGMALD